MNHKQNQELKNYPTYQLLKELVARVDRHTVATLAEILLLFGELSVKNPPLHQQIIQAMHQKTQSKDD